MQVGRIFDILFAIVVVSGITVLVGSPNTQGVVTAFGSSFSNSLKSAEGK